MGDNAKPRRTLIKGGWIVAFDGSEHRILRDGVVVLEGSRIAYFGKRHDGQVHVHETIDARGDLVIPGLINTHVHVGSQAGDRMIIDGGRRDLFRSGFLNHWPSKGIGGPHPFAFEDHRVSMKYNLASLLRLRSTTLVVMGGEFGDDPDLMPDLAAELGMRLYTTPGFSSANHHYDQGGRLQRHWDDKGGEAALDRAVAYAQRADGMHGGLIRTILVPYEQHL